MQATSNAGALEWLLSSVLLAGLHETWHLLLGQLNLSSAKGREVDVCNLFNAFLVSFPSRSPANSTAGSYLEL